MSSVREKNLAIAAPHLIKEWDFELNKEICSPESTTFGSSRVVWWRCSLGHSYQAKVADRVSKRTSCPYCSGRKTLTGFNDLGTLRPQLLKEWDYEKNTEISPETTALMSGKKAWWICAKGHKWKAVISSRSRGIGCPYCSGNRVLSGENDLETLNPNLALEWDYDKNYPLKPSEISCYSSKKVWWKCSRGHSWLSAVSGRSSGNGCPKCSKILKTSFPEQSISYYLSKHFIITKREKVNGWEVDIFLPDWKLAIEYDGIVYHSKEKVQDREARKNSALKEAGVELIRVKESFDRNDLDGLTLFFLVDTSYKNLDDAIIRLLKLISQKTGISVTESVDVKRDSMLIKGNYLTAIKEKSLAIVCPDIAKEWDYDKNNGISPELFTAYSPQKVWWRCSKGHSYQATIGNRRNGDGCPYCSGHQIIVGFNDLESKNPKLAMEWDYDKNKPLTPKEVTEFSIKKVWWICSKGHSYEASIAHRSSERGCPYCSGRKVKEGFNDLATVNPQLALEWDIAKNGNLKPTQVTANNDRKIWWKCVKGHEWQSTIASRNSGIGCPICSGKKILAGYNDLETLNPDLSIEWNYEKNGDLLPSMVRPHTMKKVWWKCKKCSHEWISTVDARSYGHGCPSCKKESISAAKRKRVRCIETNEIFDGVTVAARYYGKGYSALSMCLNRKRDTFAGYHWEYFQE